MKSTQSDKIFINVHKRRPQRLRVAQQEAFEEAELLHNFKAVDDRLEAEFLDSLRKADAILESRNEIISFWYEAPWWEWLWKDEGQQVRSTRSLLRRRLSTLTAKGSAHISPTVGASMPEVRED